jgi:excinuclease ABC subunit A
VLTGLSGSGKSVARVRHDLRRGAAALRRVAVVVRAPVPRADGQAGRRLDRGLSPAISIDQKTTSRNPRSTVGTVTEIYDYLRLLWSRVGTPHCPDCGEAITGSSAEQIIDQVMELEEGTRFMVLAPVVRGRKGEFGRLLEELRTEGFARVKVNGELRRLEEDIVLDKKFKHDVAVVVDRLVMRPEARTRLADSVETAIKLAAGIVEVEVIGGDGADVRTFSERFACLSCGTSMPELEPRIFSFNSPHGACERCTGLGSQMEIDPELVVPDPSLSIGEGALAPWASSASMYYDQVIQALAERFAVDLDAPWQDLPREHREVFLFGVDEKIQVTYKNRYGRRRSYATQFEGIVPNLERRYRETDSDLQREKIEEYMSMVPCPVCKGARLRPESLAVRIGGLGISEFCNLSVRRARTWLDELRLTDTERQIARLIVREIEERLRFLDNVGIGYLSMDRAAATLSGGEAQRIRLATQIGSALVGGALRPRRAVDRPAPARQHEAHPDARAPARPGQHGARRRARRADDAGGRPPHRHGPGAGEAGWQRGRRRAPPTRWRRSQSR